MTAPGAPDFTQPVVGYRAWRLAQDGALVPWTLSAAGPWEPGENVAACHFATFASVARTSRHRPPAPDCMCGLYALHDPTDPRIAPDAADAHGALGAVVAWGDIEVHATGWRAERACVVALAVPPGACVEQRTRLERAAERYGVALVPQSRLAEAAAAYGAPLPELGRLPRRRRAGLGERPPWARPVAPDLAPGGAVGYERASHVWVETAVDHVVVGVTRPFAALIADADLRVSVAGLTPGERVAAGDVLARVRAGAQTFLVWAPVGGEVVEAVDPGERLLAAPEGHGWLARLRPTAWATDAEGLVWGPGARREYLLTAGRAHPGLDVFADVRAERIRALPSVGSWAEVGAALRAARDQPTPRFRSTGELYDRLGVDLGCALQEDPALGARLCALGTTLSFVVSEPAGRVTLELRGEAPVLRLGETAGDGSGGDVVELRCRAEDAHRLLRGDLDAAAALRSGALRPSVPAGRALAILSVLKGVQGPYARRAAPDLAPAEVAARRLGIRAA